MTPGSAYSNDDDRRSRHLFHHGVIYRAHEAAFDDSLSEKHAKIHCNDNTVAGDRTLPPGQNTKTMKGRAVLTMACRFQQGKPRNRPDHAEFFRTRIFEPLGMRDTWFYLPKDRVARLVTLHDGESGKVVPAPQYGGVNADFPATDGAHYSGGGGLSSTVEDYATFLQLFLNKGEFNGVRLVSPKTVELMLTEQFPAINAEFGLGFGLETPDNDHQSVRSLGSFSWGGAFATTYWADPKEGLIAQIYTNVYRSAAPQLSGRFTVLTYAAMTR